MHAVKTACLKALLFFTVLCFSSHALATLQKFNYIGKKPPKGDTIPNINLFYEVKWDFYRIMDNGSIDVQRKVRPDVFSTDVIRAAVLRTTFLVDSSILYKVHSLGYGYNGSVKIILNGNVLHASGVFSNSTNTFNATKSKQEDFLNFIFKDTVVNLIIEFVPYHLKPSFNMSIQIGQQHWAENLRKTQSQSFYESYAIGFFYFSFAIVFCLLFIYFRAGKDNLYFALFCFFVATALVSDRLTDLTFFRNFANFSLAIGMEFLSIFFASVLINKEKSKKPVAIMFLLGAFFSIPTVHYKFNLGMGFTVAIFVFFFMFLYAAFSALYFLLQGFGQKKWEAKTITYGSLIGLAFSLIPSIIYGILVSNVRQVGENTTTVLNFLPNVGLCIYPVVVAIVLGKRNGLSQMRLIDQVKSIEKLSEENIEKEKEKKKILEEQNLFLETKVDERTRELAEKNKVITFKNKEITDSLLYAKRIQSAILPDARRIQEVFVDSFILYIPKDIVSGDFYCFAQKNNKVIIAAADCTGHGVAGAFMSMIGSSLLNQIINEKGITQPGLILDALNEGVVQSLKQRESESNDGMDICIAAFDFPANKVSYSGANRPLWLVRGQQLISYSPNKFPIGGLQVQHDEKFVSHEIALQKNDTYYLFSDGFADQFGGQQGKKLMSKKLKGAILDMQSYSMNEQRQQLLSLFTSWKGSNEQVDDVLIIGIRT